MPTYTINAQDIHVWEEGEADRPVAMFIHGWSSSWYALSPLFPVLNPRYRCMGVDLPGYGDSPKGRQRVSIVQYQ